MAEAQTEAPRVRSRTGYQPDPNFKPSPYDQYDVVHTSEAGGHPASLHHATNAFAEAHLHDLRTAARALDPNDPSVPESLVVLPTGQNIVPVNPEEHRERISEIAGRAVEYDDQPVNAPNVSARLRQTAAENAENAEPAEAEPRHRGVRRAEAPGGGETGQPPGQPTGQQPGS